MGAKLVTWRHKHPSRHARGYGRQHELIRAEMMRDVVLCEECTRQGRVTIGTIADHIIPLAKGGTGDRDNYQLLCRDCHDAKSIRDSGGRTKLRFAPDGWPIP